MGPSGFGKEAAGRAQISYGMLEDVDTVDAAVVMLDVWVMVMSMRLHMRDDMAFGSSVMLEL